MRSISKQYLDKMMDAVDECFVKMPKVNKSLPFIEPMYLDIEVRYYGKETLTEINDFSESDYQKWLKRYSINIKNESIWGVNLPKWVVCSDKSINWNWTGLKWNDRREYQEKLAKWQKGQDKGYNSLEDTDTWISKVLMLFTNVASYSGVSPETTALLSKTQDMDMLSYLDRSMHLPEYNITSKSVVKRSLRKFIYEINKEVKAHK